MIIHWYYLSLSFTIAYILFEFVPRIFPSRFSVTQKLDAAHYANTLFLVMVVSFVTGFLK